LNGLSSIVALGRQRAMRIGENIRHANRSSCGSLRVK
jgi:hypothetical protein